MQLRFRVIEILLSLETNPRARPWLATRACCDQQHPAKLLVREYSLFMRRVGQLFVGEEFVIFLWCTKALLISQPTPCTLFKNLWPTPMSRKEFHKMKLSKAMNFLSNESKGN